MEAILERDGHCCVWCSRSLTLEHRDLTFEHVVPKLKGGPAWAENEVPACRSCNRARGHVAPSLWLHSARRPRRHVVERSLVALEAAIVRRGGQRKARRYLTRELRRLGLNQPAAPGAVLSGLGTEGSAEMRARDLGRPSVADRARGREQETPPPAGSSTW